MDCCNYMQYRHHQPYYGNQYYDPLPPYHGEFYGPQMYQEYYGNSPYYPQQWPCAASFPDYVYNPKEARIRKAMRDATRDRSIGASPMLPRPSTRRVSHTWVSPHEEQLMMNPLTNMRNNMDGPVCNFPLPPSGNNQFMSQMNAYTKLEPSMPPPPNNNPVHTNYMQSNPLAQLQQHTEMWHDFQTMRPRSSVRVGNPFMMASEVPTYHNPPTELPTMPSQISVVATTSSLASPPPQSTVTNENIPPTEIVVGENKDSQNDFANKLMESNQDFMPSVYENGDGFEKVEDKMKKSSSASSQIRNKKPVNKPLPDFNEAFGSTERGRFQSPPDPRLAPNKGYLDYFFDSSPVKFDDYQI